jgi:uncharacterized membrane protein YqaE (UPF0057 family)
MSEIQNLYLTFLSYFPSSVHGVVSLVLAALLVYAIFKTLKKDFIYLIVLVILLPASIPILQGVWQAVLGLLKFLLSTK